MLLHSRFRARTLPIFISFNIVFLIFTQIRILYKVDLQVVETINIQSQYL